MKNIWHTLARLLCRLGIAITSARTNCSVFGIATRKTCKCINQSERTCSCYWHRRSYSWIMRNERLNCYAWFDTWAARVGKCCFCKPSWSIRYRNWQHPQHIHSYLIKVEFPFRSFWSMFSSNLVCSDNMFCQNNAIPLEPDFASASRWSCFKPSFQTSSEWYCSVCLFAFFSNSVSL